MELWGDACGCCEGVEGKSWGRGSPGLGSRRRGSLAGQQGTDQASSQASQVLFHVVCKSCPELMTTSNKQTRIISTLPPGLLLPMRWLVTGLALLEQKYKAHPQKCFQKICAMLMGTLRNREARCPMHHEVPSRPVGEGSPSCTLCTEDGECTSWCPGLSKAVG